MRGRGKKVEKAMSDEKTKEGKEAEKTGGHPPVASMPLLSPKLSVRELAVLKRLQEGNAAHYMPYMGRFRQNAYWFMSGPDYPEGFKTSKCTREMDKLIKLGLAKVTKSDWRGRTAVVA